MHNVTREQSIWCRESHGKEFGFYSRFHRKSLGVQQSMFSKDPCGSRVEQVEQLGGSLPGEIRW